jgi:hypothetical protein
MNSLAKPDDDAPNGMDMRFINKLLAAGLQSGRTKEDKA